MLPSPRVFHSGFNTIQYPPIPETRVDADMRKEPRCYAQCDRCRHKVDFQSEGERYRFIVSSRWTTLDELGEIVRCPMCQERKKRESGSVTIPKGALSEGTVVELTFHN